MNEEIQTDYRFIKDDIFLSAYMNTKSEELNLIIKKINLKTGKIELEDKIRCIHAAVVDLKPEEFIEANKNNYGREKLNEEVLDIISSEGLTEIDLTPEEKFKALESWVAGIAEAGIEAFRIQSSIESMAHMMYPLVNKLLRFVSICYPEFIFGYIEKVVRECRFEGEKHLSSLIANLIPVVNSYLSYAENEEENLFLYKFEYLKDPTKHCYIRNGFKEVLLYIGNIIDLEFLISDGEVYNTIKTLLSSAEYEGIWLEEPDIVFLKDFKEMNRKENAFTIILDEINDEYFEITEDNGIFAEKGRIIGIKFNGCDLKGIPESIGNLKKLKYADFSQNKIKIIPESFKNLENLKFLKIGYNPVKNLPECLGDLSKLTVLSLNGIKLNEPPKWKKNLLPFRPNDQLKWLEEVDKIKEEHSSDIQLDTIPLWIKNLTYLKDLEIYETRINHIPNWLVEMENLQTLDISWNPIHEIPDFLGDMVNLKSIEFVQDLCKNAQDRIRVPTVLVSKAVYKKMWFDNLSWEIRVRTAEEDISDKNVLSEFVIAGVNQGTKYLLFKKECEVMNEILKHESRFSTMQILVKNNHVISLDLYGGEGTPPYIPESISELKYLQRIYILCSDHLRLPESFGDLKELVSVSILCDDLQKLPESFDRLEKLQYLSLGDHHSNSFGCDFREVPPQIRHLKNLKYLDLSYSRHLTELPKWLDEMYNLKKIFIYGCNIRKMPPSEDRKTTSVY